MLRRARAAGIALILSVCVSTPAYAELDRKVFDPPVAISGFELTTHLKEPFGPEQLEGKWTLILLGYTNCPDVCPFTLNNLANVTEQLKFQLRPEKVPQVVFIGVDPERDAENLADYVAHFDPAFLGATGAWDEVKKLVEKVSGFVRFHKKGKDDDAYLVRHSSRISVINPNGQLVSQINPPLPPSETAIYISTLMRDHEKRAASLSPKPKE